MNESVALLYRVILTFNDTLGPPYKKESMVKMLTEILLTEIVLEDE